MLNRTITAEEFNALPDEVKAHYAKRGTKYVIDLSGVDPELETTQAELDKARRAKIDLEAQVRSLSDEAKTTEERVRKETETKINELSQQNEKLTTAQINAEREKHIAAIAGNFKTEGLIRSDLRDRVKVELVDGEVKTTFINKEGKEVDFKSLNEEYCKNPDYSVILKTGTNTPSFQPPKHDDGSHKQPQGGAGGEGGLDYNKGDVRAIADRLNQIT